MCVGDFGTRNALGPPYAHVRHLGGISAAPATIMHRALEVELDGEKEEDAGGEDRTDYVANHGGPRED